MFSLYSLNGFVFFGFFSYCCKSHNGSFIDNHTTFGFPRTGQISSELFFKNKLLTLLHLENCIWFLAELFKKFILNFYSHSFEFFYNHPLCFFLFLTPSLSLPLSLPLTSSLYPFRLSDDLALRCAKSSPVSFSDHCGTQQTKSSSKEIESRFKTFLSKLWAVNLNREDFPSIPPVLNLL